MAADAAPQEPRHDTGIAIIGCSPVGATLANLLGLQGVQHWCWSAGRRSAACSVPCISTTRSCGCSRRPASPSRCGNGRRRGRFHRRKVLGSQCALDRQHLCAGQGHLARRRCVRRRHLVLPDRRLCFRHGHAADAAEAIQTAGGKVLGSARMPLGTTDFPACMPQASTGDKDVGPGSPGPPPAPATRRDQPGAKAVRASLPGSPRSPPRSAAV